MILSQLALRAIYMHTFQVVLSLDEVFISPLFFLPFCGVGMMSEVVSVTLTVLSSAVDLIWAVSPVEYTQI